MRPEGNGAAPTYNNYPDKGCSITPSCRNCPLPLCRYDDPGGYLAWRRDQRRTKVLALMQAKGTVKPGILVLAIAADCSVGKRQAWRILVEERSKANA